MKQKTQKGSMTVFLSLVCTLFVALICTSVESIRFQCARAEAAASLDMANFSLFGEFENRLLDTYDVFGLDGACGTGFYSIAELEWKLEEYIRCNTSPDTGRLVKGWDPFQVQLDSAKITGVTLLTDENGAAFYQQAVGFMHDNFATEAVDIWLERKQQADNLQTAADNYQREEQSSSKNLSDMQDLQQQEDKRQQEAKEAMKKEAEENGVIWIEEEPEPKKEVQNPLDTIKEIKRMGFFGLILGEDKVISQKSLGADTLSRRRIRSGSLPVKKQYSGLASDLLFQEYLFERFGRYGKTDSTGGLDYELEYILCGKNSDEKNLRAVINKLLLMREGANFLYLCSNAQRKQEADALATVLGGAIPVPGLTVVISYALLLAWAYGESILDLHILMSGGKLPVWKDDQSWHMDLEDIPRILEVLAGHGQFQTEKGLSYEGYLQILFTLGTQKRYPLRALDLVERKMQAAGNYGFRADQILVKMQTKAEYTIPPLFLRVTNAFVNAGSYVEKYQATGTFAY